MQTNKKVQFIKHIMHRNNGAALFLYHQIEPVSTSVCNNMFTAEIDHKELKQTTQRQDSSLLFVFLNSLPHF